MIFHVIQEHERALWAHATIYVYSIPHQSNYVIHYELLIHSKYLIVHYEIPYPHTSPHSPTS